MTTKTVPFTKAQAEAWTQTTPTPFHLYDEAAIRANARAFMEAFAWVPGGFTNYFAVKALPNPHILKILSEEGMGADCSSVAELIMAEKAGITGSSIMFTSNDTPASEFIYAKKLNAVINLDDISHIEFLEKNAGLPETLCFRFNPGAMKEGNTIIGHPEEAKYGFTKDQLIQGYADAKAKGVKHFGLHAMVASNELNPAYFVETARILLSLVSEVKEKTGAEIEFINLGGGIGIPYKLDDTRVDLQTVSDGIKNAYEELITKKGLPPVKIVMECGRMVTGPYGYLISRVLHRKNTYKKFVGLDSCMANLMRPALYGAYHHITVLGKENLEPEETVDVTGSLCENNDKFAIDRPLPRMEVGDLVVIHDTGAHGFAMGFNYNGKLRSAELLLKKDGTVKEIRRAETIDDYFATLDFSEL